MKKINIIEKIKEHKKLIYVILIIIILAIIKQLLLYNYPIMAFIGATSDDVLMVKLAKNILSGNWLGKYNYNTLMKGPVFPMILALLKQMNLSYIGSITFLYTISCIIFMIAIRKKVKNNIWFIIIYVALLFNPIMYTKEILQRVYRNSLIPSFALLIIGSYIAIFLRRDKKIRYLIPWIIIQSISLSAFYYTREDSMWIVPFIIFMTICTIIAKVIKEKKINFELISKTFILFIPIITLMIFGNWIANQNLKYYGLKTKNVLTDSSFSDAMRAMYTVRPMKYIDAVSITTEKIDRMASVSKSFNAITPKLKEYASNYGAIDRNPGDGEIEDGWILWALRSAVFDSGCDTLLKEDEAYRKIAIELNQAMEDGLLEKEISMPSAMMSPFRASYIPTLIKSFIKSVIYISSYDGIVVTSTDASETDPKYFEGVKEFEDITNDRAIFPDNAVDNNGNKLSELEGQQEYINSLNMQTNILKILQKIYTFTGIPLLILGLISYIIITVLNIKKLLKRNYEDLEDWIIFSGILGAIFTLIFGIAYNHTATVYSIVCLYLCGAYPLYVAFSNICMYNMFEKIKCRRKINK